MPKNKAPAEIHAALDYSKPLTPAGFLSLIGHFKTTAGTFHKWKSYTEPAEPIQQGKQTKIKTTRGHD